MTLRIRIRLLLMVGLAIACVRQARANDASYHGDGATVFAFKEERVAMLSEKVTLDYDAAAEIGARWKADCVFTFENLTDAPITIQMGFPDYKIHEDSPRRGWATRDFTTEVDGVRVEAVHKLVDNDGGGARVTTLPRRVKLEYGAAYTWPVTFAPRGRAVVRNTYRIGGFHSNGPLDAFVPRKERAQVFWRAGKKKEASPFEDGLCSSIRYIVKSGRTWARPIGEAEIAIAIPPDLWPHTVVPRIAATEVDGRWVRWRFRSFSPEREIDLVFAHPLPDEESGRPPLFASVAQARAWLRFARKNGYRRDAILALVEGYRAWAGETPTARVSAFFAARGMFPEPTGKDQSTRVDRAVRALLEGELAKLPQ